LASSVRPRYRFKGPRGSISFRYVTRGRHPDYPLPTYLKDEDGVAPEVIRSVCRAMGLPPGIFELGPEDFGIDEDEAYQAPRRAKEWRAVRRSLANGFDWFAESVTFERRAVAPTRRTKGETPC